MAEPASSGAAGIAAFKFFGIPLAAATLGATMAFMLMPPQSPKEWFHRLFCTFLCSLTLGPILFFAFASTGIGGAIVATAVNEVAGSVLRIPFADALIVVDTAYVKLVLASPFLMFGGLPGWYVLGWVIRALERRKGKDLLEVAQEIGRVNRRFDN